MMLQMATSNGGMQVKESFEAKIYGLNKHRCTGMYNKSGGFRSALRRSRRQQDRNGTPWKEGYRFHAWKTDDRWIREAWSVNKAKDLCLIRSGRERIRVKCFDGPISIFKGRVCFHPEKHWVDFLVYVNANAGDYYEAGVACKLDGKHCIDLVSENWVVPVQEHGKWTCKDCRESGSELAEDGYIKAQFDTREALLLDHLEPVLDGITYLHTHRFVRVFLDSLCDLGNTSSGVHLSDQCSNSANKNWFRIPIGKVEMQDKLPLDDSCAAWICRTLDEKVRALQSENTK